MNIGSKPNRVLKEDDPDVDWCGDKLTIWNGDTCTDCGRIWGHDAMQQGDGHTLVSSDPLTCECGLTFADAAAWDAHCVDVERPTV